MIPKIIHICWLSGDPYPPLIENCINSMRTILSDYEIKVWTKENFDINSVQWVKESFETKKYAFAADYIRFWSLYNFGGIYLDSDVEVIKNFDEFLNNVSFTCFEYLNFPEAAVVGAEKGCEWIKGCLDWYQGKSFINKDGSYKRQVVPHLVKMNIEKTYNQKIFDYGKIQHLNGLTLYPYWYFSPKNYFTDKIEIRPETVCVHRFASAWGADEKRKWTLILHNVFIHLFGKKIHDKLYRLVKPLPETFNGDKV